MLKDFRVTDSLGLEGFRVKGIWRLHDLGVKPSSACYELRMLQRDRVQWITAADSPSCGQKRHTRWPATNAKCWLAIVRSEKTHTLTCNEFRLVMWPHTLTCNEFRLVMWLRTVREVPTIKCLSLFLSIDQMLSLSIYISLSLYLSVCLCVYLSIYLSMSLPIYFSICLGI